MLSYSLLYHVLSYSILQYHHHHYHPDSFYYSTSCWAGWYIAVILNITIIDDSISYSFHLFYSAINYTLSYPSLPSYSMHYVSYSILPYVFDDDDDVMIQENIHIFYQLRNRSYDFMILYDLFISYLPHHLLHWYLWKMMNSIFLPSIKYCLLSLHPSNQMTIHRFIHRDTKIDVDKHTID